MSINNSSYAIFVRSTVRHTLSLGFLYLFIVLKQTNKCIVLGLTLIFFLYALHKLMNVLYTDYHLTYFMNYKPIIAHERLFFLLI